MPSIHRYIWEVASCIPKCASSALMTLYRQSGGPRHSRQVIQVEIEVLVNLVLPRRFTHSYKVFSQRV